MLGSVAPEELVVRSVAEAGQRIAEDLEGMPAALGVRVVGGEHEQLRTTLLDEPGSVLKREWREPNLAADVLRRLELELLQQRLELGERPVRVIEVAEHPRHPARALLDRRAAQLRVTVEDTVENEARQEALRRVVQHREVLAPQVLAAPEPVGRACPTVLVVFPGEQLAAADVQHKGDAGLGETGPDRLEIDVRRREGPWRFRRQPDGGDAEFERDVELLDRPARLIQR